MPLAGQWLGGGQAAPGQVVPGGAVPEQAEGALVHVPIKACSATARVHFKITTLFFYLNFQATQGALNRNTVSLGSDTGSLLSV
eukprot:960706-Pelagomonas_calceolata.AAC.1